MRRRISLFLILFVAPVLTWAAPAPDSLDMPKLLYGQELSAYPVFVAADLALDAHGALDTAMFPPSVHRALGDYIRQGPRQDNGCVSLPSWTFEHEYELQASSRQTFADAIRNARVVVLADVTGVQVGFRRVRAGSLIRLRPRSTLKGSLDLAIDRYVFVPVAELALGSDRLCKRNTAWADLPAVGDQLLLLSDTEIARSLSGATVRMLELGGATGIATLKKNGYVSLPRHFGGRPSESDHPPAKAQTTDDRRSIPRTKEPFLELVRSLIAERGAS